MTLHEVTARAIRTIETGEPLMRPMDLPTICERQRQVEQDELRRFVGSKTTSIMRGERREN